TQAENNHPATVVSHALDRAMAGQSFSLLGKDSDVGLKVNDGGRAANQVISYLPIWGSSKEVLGAIDSSDRCKLPY
ncbi:MAG: hypothetical protein K8R55_00720, partial [Desulfuromonadaceae bacterium]|nr:hypothetical protein [Desulfuromonadaceae bacterium]